MIETCAPSRWQDLFFADVPSGVDKYTVRKWLIGHAVLRGWQWRPSNDLSGCLSIGDERVVVTIVAEGVHLKTAQQESVVFTPY